MSAVTWTPKAADASRIKDTDGKTCTYTMTEGNTLHHVAELITPILNEKRSGDFALS